MRKQRNVVVWLLMALAGAASLAGQENAASLGEQYRETAERIIRAATNDDGGWEKLTHLTTQIGHRLSGSPQLDAAVQWAAERMKAEGLDNVWLQPVKVPHWVRGREEAAVVAPVERPLAILGLGGSVGTPPEGTAAPAVVVDSFEELEKLGKENVAGKIVVYTPQWEGYGRTVQYRSNGASRAARLGAVAVLVRSATGRSLYTPHTGAMNYADDAPKIPAAAITVEDAEWFRRMRATNIPLRVRLRMEAQMFPDADSANVIGEITGREKPEEVVVLGGHMDSWDVGQGAHDDGAGVMAAWQAVTLLKQLGLRPRRTVRVVLWTNEENGLRGGQAYRDWVGEKVGNHVAAIEMDGGAEKPVGFGFGPGGARGGPRPAGGGGGSGEAPGTQSSAAADGAFEKVQQIGQLLAAIEAGEITRGGGGADIGPLVRDGVPGFSLRTVGEHYFDWHHSHADTLDKVNRDDFRRSVAALAVMAYVLAEMPERLNVR